MSQKGKNNNLSSPGEKKNERLEGDGTESGVLLSGDGIDPDTGDSTSDGSLVGGAALESLMGDAANEMLNQGGGAETDEVPLTEFGTGTVTGDGSTITVDLGGGSSFTISYANIENVVRGDPEASIDDGTVLDREVAEMTVVTLDVPWSRDLEGDPPVYLWRQFVGPLAPLSDPSAAQPTFTSPAVCSETTLAFSVVVNDGTTSHVDTIEITVLPTVAGCDSALRGDTSSEVIDFGDSSTSVSVDITLTVAPGTDGADADPRARIEGVRGSIYDDLFAFSNLQGGTVYVVDGNGGRNTIDVSSFSSIAATFGDGTMAIDMGDGQMCQIDFDCVDLIRFSDVVSPVVTADAGADQVVDKHCLVTLDASASSNLERRSLIYSWAQTSGPAVRLIGARTSQPSFPAPVTASSTTLTFELEVSNGKSWATATVEILVIPQHLIANWIFEEDGQTVTDITGHGNTLTLGADDGADGKNPIRTTDPDHGGVLCFDGSEGSIEGIPQNPAGNFSISAWVKDTGAKSGGWHVLYAAHTEVWLGMSRTAKPTVGMHVGGNGNWVETAAGTWSRDAWHHITGTWDGTKAHIYVDGIDMALTVRGSLKDPVATDALIGAYSSSDEHFTGLLDDFRVYSKALDVSDARSIAGLSPLDAVDQYATQAAGHDVLTLEVVASDETPTADAGPDEDAGSDEPDEDVTFPYEAPTADAGPDQDVIENTVVTLDATGTNDPDKSLTYEWMQTGGIEVTLSDATAVQPTFTAPQSSGSYVIAFELAVTDGVATVFDSVMIRVTTRREAPTPNDEPGTTSVTVDDNAPTANAGPDQAVIESAVVTLDATASSDPKNQSLFYCWTQLSGFGVFLSDANSAQPTFVAVPNGMSYQLTFQVAVSNGTTTAFDTVDVAVAPGLNDPPIADSGADLFVTAGDRDFLNGLGSLDPENDTLTFKWTQVSGPPLLLSGTDSPDPTFTVPQDASGVAIFELVVNDGRASSTDTVSVFITALEVDEPANERPPESDTVELPEGDTVELPESDTVELPEGDTVELPEGDIVELPEEPPPPAVDLDPVPQQDPSDEPSTPIDQDEDSSPAESLQDNDEDAVSESEQADEADSEEDEGGPEISAGADFSARSGDYVSLAGCSVTSDEDSVLYEWQQLSGPEVTLDNNERLATGFVTPDGLADKVTLVFEFTAANAKGTSSDTISVVVVPTADDAERSILMAPVEAGKEVVLAALPELLTTDGMMFQWRQTDGKPVDLKDADGPAPRFRAPDVYISELLEFEVSATDGECTIAGRVRIRIDATGTTQDQRLTAQVDEILLGVEEPALKKRRVGGLWASLKRFLKSR